MEDFKQWFEEKHGVWPWHPGDTTSVAFRRIADGVAAFVDEALGKKPGNEITTPWGVKVRI